MNPEKVLDAIDIVIESLHRPDENLRSQAHSMKCYEEMLVVRKWVIENLERERKDIKLIESLELDGKMQEYFDLIWKQGEEIKS